MKHLFTFFAILSAFTFYGQDHFCSKAKRASAARTITHQQRTSALLPQISHELKYDVKFVHLNLNVERTTKFISGGVKTIATVTASALDTFACLLYKNHAIDSIRFNGLLTAFTRKDSMVKVAPVTPLANGQSFTVTIYYQGIPPVGGSAIGSGFSTGTSGSWGNQATWSLSESLVAYHWWPCKQIITDKIDSSWVYITTDSLNMAGSNGLLKNVVTVGSKKRFEWKSKYPIAYYLISVAVAKYKEYKLYAHPQYLPNDSILIQNFIYDNAINNGSFISTQKAQLNKMPQVLEFQSKMYGMYPFYKEKYGHCMAPFGGGMEHQTMTSLGFFDYYIDAHELGHHWWGDNVTCKSWGDIWINEGFASYTEHLCAQYLDPGNFQPNLNSAHTSVMSQPGGSIFFTGADTLDANRIFDSRLTYDKGGAIINTLRFVTNNDSLWFNTLRSFQNAYKNSTASASDFMNYYQTQTGINSTQFFNQWYYGQGYPTFTVKYNTVGNTCFIKSTQSTSVPSSVPLFITPMEYKITRSGAPDTTVRVTHSNTTEFYSFNLTGTVTGVVCDPNNWVINKVVGPTLDGTLVGLSETINEVISINIGPNPTRNYLKINNSIANGKLEVFEMGGKKVLQLNLTKEMNVDFSGFCDGVYILKFTDNQGLEKYTHKIIKE
ncbi:MAG: T9SS type A sorting domain-containing protein [Bacteroidetes bacterium]|nr:T9SS type A sorting domain-containing protein [Bacteroidota bacterium]